MNNTLSYFVVIGGQQAGPYTLEQLRSLWKAGKANLATQFWSDDGFPDWRSLSEIVVWVIVELFTVTTDAKGRSFD
jgi:hypothetical protein